MGIVQLRVVRAVDPTQLVLSATKVPLFAWISTR